MYKLTSYKVYTIVLFIHCLYVKQACSQSTFGIGRSSGEAWIAQINQQSVVSPGKEIHSLYKQSILPPSTSDSIYSILRPFSLVC